MRVMLIMIVWMVGCNNTVGVRVLSEFAWADDDAVRPAVDMIFGTAFWDDASPGIDIVFTADPSIPDRYCQGPARGCYLHDYASVDQIFVLVEPEAGKCLADTALVHELMHRWQYDHDMTDVDHPHILFGGRGDLLNGGWTGIYNQRLKDLTCMEELEES